MKIYDVIVCGRTIESEHVLLHTYRYTKEPADIA